MRELVISICDKVCCSADCHCKRYDDGDEFTCESCFIQEAIASAITSAVEQERTRILKLLEEADPLMANSHGWEDDTSEQLASNIHDYLVWIVRQTPTQEGV